MLATQITTFAAPVGATTLAIFALRATAALVLGALVGVERQWRQRMAGLRTNALVALGSATFELLGVFLTGIHGTDPSRIAAYVVSGIGFLGAGVIMREGGGVRGINTAATIWCSAAVGVLAGAGLVLEAAVAAALIVFCNVALRPVARQIDGRPGAVVEEEDEPETLYCFEVVCDKALRSSVRGVVGRHFAGEEFTLTSLGIEDSPLKGQVAIVAELRRVGRDDLLLEQAVTRIGAEEGVTKVSWSSPSHAPTPVGDEELLRRNAAEWK